MLDPKGQSKVNEKFRELVKGRFYGPRELMLKRWFEEKLKRRSEEAQNENDANDFRPED